MRALPLLAALALVAPILAAEPTLTLEPERAAIGDPIVVTIELDWPEQAAFEAPSLGPRWGKFDVLEEGWSASLEQPGRWSWQGKLAAFELGELQLPSRSIVASLDGETLTASTPQRSVEIVSVLDEPDDDGALSGLRDQTAIAPRWGTLIAAGALLAALLAGSALLWWWLRRRAERPRPAPVKIDPFARQAPHEWVYAELQRLLERKLPERGELVRFYSELSRILKHYLSGRFRIDLMERTSSEVPEVLAQAGVASEDIERVRAVLADCDAVKFAAARPEAAEWKAIVERIYRVVDRTRPAAAPEREEVA